MLALHFCNLSSVVTHSLHHVLGGFPALPPFPLHKTPHSLVQCTDAVLRCFLSQGQVWVDNVWGFLPAQFERGSGSLPALSRAPGDAHQPGAPVALLPPLRCARCQRQVRHGPLLPGPTGTWCFQQEYFSLPFCMLTVQGRYSAWGWHQHCLERNICLFRWQGSVNSGVKSQMLWLSCAHSSLQGIKMLQMVM